MTTDNNNPTETKTNTTATATAPTTMTSHEPQTTTVKTTTTAITVKTPTIESTTTTTRTTRTGYSLRSRAIGKQWRLNSWNICSWWEIATARSLMTQNVIARSAGVDRPSDSEWSACWAWLKGHVRIAINILWVRHHDIAVCILGQYSVTCAILLKWHACRSSRACLQDRDSLGILQPC